MKYKSKILFFLCAMVFFISCGSRKNVKALPKEDAAVSKVISKHYEKEAAFNTAQGRLQLKFQNEDVSQSVTVSFRMKKGDTIWMSGKLLGFPLAKVLITPNSVQYYEKINKTYFDGDFRLISNLLGIPLDFENIQNLLIGQAIYDLEKDRYKLSDSFRGYELTPATEQFLKKMFLLDPATYKTLAQQISQESQNRNVTITYPEYQQINGQAFPKKIKIIASEGSSNTLINLEYRSLELNVPVSFPFSIPSGYEEIIIR